MLNEFTKQTQTISLKRLAVFAAVLLLAGATVYGFLRNGGTKSGRSEFSSQSRKGLERYTPSPAEWASLTIQPVAERGFRYVTERKIAIDEDRSTPVFSPYAGRVTKLLAKPGDQRRQGPAAVRDRGRRQRSGAKRFHRRDGRHEQGEVRARSGAAAGHARQGPVRGQGRSAERLPAEPGDANPGRKRHALVARRRWKRRATSCASSASPMRTSRPSRKSAASIPRPPSSRRSPAPWSSARSAPGQYVNAGASDPVYVIGDLSTVWMTAFVRESDCASVAVGQERDVQCAGAAGPDP